MVKLNDLTDVEFHRYTNPFNRNYEFQVECQYKGTKHFYSKKLTVIEAEKFNWEEELQPDLIKGLLKQINRDEKLKEK